MTTQSQSITTRADTMLGHPAAHLDIADQQSYVAVGDWAKQLSPIIAEIETTFGPIVAAANTAHKTAIERRDKFLKPLKHALDQAKKKCLKYEMQKRLEAEQQQRALDKKMLDLQESAAIDCAAIAEERGQPELAAAIIADPIIPLHVPAPSGDFQKIKGLTRKRPAKAEVFDLRALIAHCATHEQYTNLLQPNLPALNAMIRSQGGRFSIDGVRII